MQQKLAPPHPASLPGAIRYRVPKGDEQSLRYLETAALRTNLTIRARLRQTRPLSAERPMFAIPR